MRSHLALLRGLGLVGLLVAGQDAAAQTCSTSITDGDGYIWDLSLGAFYVNNGTYDAYDGGNQLFVDSTSFFASSCTQDAAGRTRSSGTDTISSIDVTREVYVPDDKNWARWFDSFHNPTAADISISVRYYTNLGSDSGTVIVDTSDGDTTIDADDTWTLTDDFSSTAADPSVLHVFADPDADEQPSSVTYGTGYYNIYFDLTIPAGDTVSLVIVDAQEQDRADGEDAAITLGVDFEDIDEGLTAEQASQVVNFSFNDRPEVTLAGTVDVSEGDVVTYTATATDPDGTVDSYDWDCDGDGTFERVDAGDEVDCTIGDPGVHGLVQVRVFDDLGGSTIASLELTVANVDPVIDVLTVPLLLEEGEVGTFQVVATDEGDSEVAVSWDFGDDTMGLLAQEEHGYLDDGDMVVTVTVDDGEGSSVSQSATVEVINVAPSFSGDPVHGILQEGTASVFTFAWVDPGVGDDHTLSIDWGDGSGASSPNAILSSGEASSVDVSHTFPTAGDFVVTATVTDDDGGSEELTYQVSVGNVAPAITLGALPSGTEGAGLAFRAFPTDAGSGDLEVTWAFGDGGTASGELTSHAFTDDGTFSVTATVSDGLATASATGSVTISNGDPVLFNWEGGAAFEGADVAYSLSMTDPGSADTHTWSWDFGGHGVVTDAADATANFPDDGTYNVTVTVTDDDGGVGTFLQSVVVQNVAPSIDAASVPAVVDEGSAQSLSVTTSDPGDDVVTVAWTFSEGGSGTGSSLSHTWSDDGDFVVTITATDEDGGTTTETHAVQVDNVAPSLGDAPTDLEPVEDVQWTFTPQATDPGSDELSFALTDGPFDMTVDSTTGELVWTPDLDDALAGEVTVTLTVDDGDGGTDELSFTLTPSFVDDDGDGLADSWEQEQGLDTTTDDADGDADGDGVSNLEEFERGSDPTTYEGPGEPEIISPAEGDEPASLSPELRWTTPAHPLGLVTTYTVEVYEDGVLVASYEVEPEAGAEEADFTVDVELGDNTAYTWRLRGSDGYVDTDWVEGGFFVNTSEDAPETPLPIFPTDGLWVAPETSLLQFHAAVDLDLDPVVYHLEVIDAGGAPVTSALAWVPDDPEAAEHAWPIDVLLEEDASYQWRVQAEDDEGLVSAWSAWQDFMFTALDEPPLAPVFLSPEEGEAVEGLSALLVVSEVVDPEGSEVAYHLAVATDEAFTEPMEVVLSGDGSGEVHWDLQADGIAFGEHTTAWARVRAEDQTMMSSEVSTTSFFLRGPNDPPSVPVILDASKEAFGAVAPSELGWSLSVDPEGDRVRYGIVVARDEALDDVVWRLDDIEGGEFDVQVTPGGPFDDGVYHWAARGVDAYGAASDWSEPGVFEVDASFGVSSGDCGCSTSGTGVGWWLGALGLLAIRRRRD